MGKAVVRLDRRILLFNHTTRRHRIRKVVYLGLDAHVRSCVLAGMDSRGKLLFNERFSTSESALKSQLVAVKAHKEILALEESPLAGWLSGAFHSTSPFWIL